MPYRRLVAIDEIIDVRTDEGLNVDRLAAYLEDRLENARGPLTLRQFAGGHANLTYLLSYPAGDYVLRRPPLGPVAPGSHDMSREFSVLSRLWQAFPPAPRAHLLCDDQSVIGSPFFVMERKRGVVVRNAVPEQFGGGKDVEANRKLSDVVIDTLGDFHAVDPATCGLESLGRPDGFLDRQVDGWRDRWRHARHEDNPTAERVADWIVNHKPSQQTPTLVHNDWRLDNMAVAGDDPGKCVAVFDWDMCTRGDPLSDLGYLLTFWSEAGDDPRWIESAAMPTRAPGFPTRDQLIDRYAVKTGFDCSHADWYHVFGVFKIAVILQQIYIRYLRGQTQDRRFATFGNRVAGLVEKGRALAKL
jgi:aminoglycoside phosphotransferase (APT) family kinase protein